MLILFCSVDLCADCDCAVWGQALQLCPSQCGAVAVVSFRGSWRTAVGPGRRTRDIKTNKENNYQRSLCD